MQEMQSSSATSATNALLVGSHPIMKDILHEGADWTPMTFCHQSWQSQSLSLADDVVPQTGDTVVIPSKS